MQHVSLFSVLSDVRAHLRATNAATWRAWRLVTPVVVAMALAGAACGPAPAAQAPAPAKPAPAAQAPAPPTQPAPPAAPPAKSAAEKPAQPAASGSQQRLFVASTNSTSSYYTYHVAEAKYLNAKVPGVNLTVVETGGGNDNIGRIAKGELHLGLLSGGVTYQAYHGIGDFTGKQTPDLRYLWMYTVGARVVIVAEQSGVTKLADLNGKPFNPGLARSATEKDFKAHADILGIKPNYYTAGLDDAVQAIKDRRIVGLVKAQPGLSVDGSTMDLMTAVKIRPVGYSDEEIKKIQEQRPWDAFITVKKDEWAKGFDAFKTLMTVTGTGTTKSMSEDLAYKLTRAIMEPDAADQIGAAASFVKGWDFRKRTLELASIPLHVGALKYFREVGDKVPEHLIPPEAK
jgi:TRAP transporter TAXI family solute receptor